MSLFPKSFTIYLSFPRRGIWSACAKYPIVVRPRETPFEMFIPGITLSKTEFNSTENNTYLCRSPNVIVIGCIVTSLDYIYKTFSVDGIIWFFRITNSMLFNDIWLRLFFVADLARHLYVGRDLKCCLVLQIISEK